MLLIYYNIIRQELLVYIYQLMKAKKKSNNAIKYKNKDYNNNKNKHMEDNNNNVDNKNNKINKD